MEVQIVEGPKDNVCKSCCRSPDQKLYGTVNTREGADYGYRHRLTIGNAREPFSSLVVAVG